MFSSIERILENLAGPRKNLLFEVLHAHCLRHRARVISIAMRLDPVHGALKAGVCEGSKSLLLETLEKSWKIYILIGTTNYILWEHGEAKGV